MTLKKKHFFILLITITTLTIILVLKNNLIPLEYFLKKYFEKLLDLKFFILFNLIFFVYIYSNFKNKKINYFEIILLILLNSFGYQLIIFLKSIDTDSLFTIFATSKEEIFFYLESLKFIFIITKYNYFIFFNTLFFFLIIINFF